MKPVVTSTVLHAALLSWGLWSFGAPEPMEMGEALPVSLVPISEYSQATVGARDAPVAEQSAPEQTRTPETLPMPAENVGDNEVDLASPPRPEAAPRERVQTAAAEAPPPPPPPAVTPTPAPAPEPTPEPVPEVAEAAPPEPTPAEPTPTPTLDELAQLPAEPETPPAPPAPPRNVPAPQKRPTPPKPPEPTRVAEARPTPPRPETAKAPEKPAEQASEEKSFDADEIAALLNRESSAGGGARRSTQAAALGASRQTGGTLSQSEMDALRGQISRCWNPPAGAMEAGSFRVRISMQLDPSGELQGMPQIESGGGSTIAERAASEAAVRAVRRCAPYNLPADKYDTWAQVTVNFDPSQMF